MTIRRKLLSAAIINSLLLTTAICVLAGVLHQACEQLHTIRRLSVPAVQDSGTVATRAAELSNAFAKYADARSLRDRAAAERTGRNIRDALAALTDTADDLKRKGLAAGTPAGRNRAAAADRFNAAAASLDHRWRVARDLPESSDGFDDLYRLDDDALRIMHDAFVLQKQSEAVLTGRVNEADHFLAEAVKLGLFIAVPTVLVTTLLGVLFANRLAGRLERIRVKALAIAEGDLQGSLDVMGEDEVDQLALQFNSMVRSLRDSRLELEHQSMHDALTGLPNRTLFRDRLDRRIESAMRGKGDNFAVLFIDVDQFKLINDSLGHTMGDELLRVLSQRLVSVLLHSPAGDVRGNTVARLGGDEFTALLEDVEGEAEVIAITERLRAAIAVPMTIDGHELSVTCSIGIATGGGAFDSRTLMCEADLALYRAKRDGRNGHALFDAKMRDDVTDRLRIKTALGKAVENRELSLNYQPIVDLQTGQVLSFESLLRWSTGGTCVRPDVFIPIAEETGQIVEIGKWVIDEACAQLKAWRDVYGGRPPALTINLSRRQIVDPDLPATLQAAIDRNGLDAQSIILEITESMLGDVPAIAAALQTIKSLGVQIYLDDFGTGYSTLGSLLAFPVDGIKVDKSLIHGIETDSGRLAVLNTVVQLAKVMNVPVIAEGIETTAQADLLRDLACPRAQGYLFGRPKSADEAAVYLRDQREAKRAA